MSEPNEFPPPPFTPAPLEASERSGCRKALLFGCGGLFLLFVLGLVAIEMNAPEIIRGILTYVETDYSSKLAPDVPAADRQRLHRAFEAARAHPDPQALSALQPKIMDLSAKTQLSRADVAGLCETLEKVNAPPPAPVAPAPGPDSPPAPSDGPRPPTA
jgi:hypothetical protein